jgi:HK97 family phage major capsid protein
LLADPTTGHLRFSPQETEAVRVVTEGMAMRGMTIGTDSAGGFAVPFTLDPSIMLTSNGALNPIRSVARVFTVATDKWKGVSSAGVSASYHTKACVATGTPKFSPHRLRRRRGSLYYKHTGSLAEVAVLLGDSKRVAADHYVHALTHYREVDRSIALARAT